MRLYLNPRNVEDYRLFLQVKQIPSYRFDGRVACIPDEYASILDVDSVPSNNGGEYKPPGWMFDYQSDITTLAIAKRKFCLFIECGLGKTAIGLEWCRAAQNHIGRRRPLIIAPLMVVQQTIQEAAKYYGEAGYRIEQVRAAGLQPWLNDTSDGTVGITNYEALRPNITRGNLGALWLDESSMLKSHYGKWGSKCLEMGSGLEWKLAGTGTPAPNDRIEYANHAVFMDAFPTVNSFLAKFFVNRGQTPERWAMKPHAIEPFYRALSHWSIFVTNPGTYGWNDHSADIPPVHVHIHDVDLTEEQSRLGFGTTGQLFADRIGGITNRSVLSQIAKGWYKGREIESRKPAYIRDLVASWPDESTIIWCHYNAEQASLERTIPEAHSMHGKTPEDTRRTMIDDFKAGRVKTIISKPKILGFGLNLQIATRQVFSACQDSYEEYHQAVKRSNRVGSTRPLNVHIPVTDIERIQMDNVLRKARMVQADTDEQERIFKGAMV
jgi:hypothetical protein